MGQISNKNQGIMTMARALQGVFKQLTWKNREYAWKAVTTGQGKDEVKKLINNPERSLSPFGNLHSFREWMEENE
jgi:hypothetical protein